MIGVVGPGNTLVLAELARRGEEVAVDPPHLAGLSAVIVLGGGIDMNIVDAAVAGGVPYVDASSDAAFVTGVLARHAGAAVPVVPACGFDGLLGDLAAAVAAEHFGGPVDHVTVHHDRDAVLVGQLGHPRRVSFPNGSRWVVDAPFVEQVLVPRHVPGAEVTTTLAVPAPIAAVAPLAARVARRLAPHLGRRLGTFQVVAEATGMGPRSFVVCDGDGPDVVGARLLVTAARAVAQSGQVPGAMAPAEAFDAERFLDAVAGPDLRWSFAFPEPGDLSV